MSGEGITDSRRPLDTSTLGAIRVDLSQVASRARLVRQALLHIGDPAVAPSLPIEDRYAAREMANASDETLAMLGRMLR
jgi:hypothetical protein